MISNWKAGYSSIVAFGLVIAATSARADSYLYVSQSGVFSAAMPTVISPANPTMAVTAPNGSWSISGYVDSTPANQPGFTYAPGEGFSAPVYDFVYMLNGTQPIDITYLEIGFGANSYNALFFGVVMYFDLDSEYLDFTDAGAQAAFSGPISDPTLLPGTYQLGSIYNPPSVQVWGVTPDYERVNYYEPISANLNVTAVTPEISSFPMVLTGLVLVGLFQACKNFSRQRFLE